MVTGKWNLASTPILPCSGEIQLCTPSPSYKAVLYPELCNESCHRRGTLTSLFPALSLTPTSSVFSQGSLPASPLNTPCFRAPSLGAPVLRGFPHHEPSQVPWKAVIQHQPTGGALRAGSPRHPSLGMKSPSGHSSVPGSPRKAAALPSPSTSRENTWGSEVQPPPLPERHMGWWLGSSDPINPLQFQGS